MVILLQLFSKPMRSYHTRIILKLFFHMHTLKVNGFVDEGFIYQQDNATSHTHKKPLTWYEENFMQLINNHSQSPNSPVPQNFVHFENKTKQKHLENELNLSKFFF